MTEEQIRSILSASPFHEFLAMELVSVDTTERVLALRLAFADRYKRTRLRPEVHGGVTAAFIDVAGTMAVVACTGKGVPTISLLVNYLRMANESNLIATARIRKLGKTVACVDVDVTDDSQQVIALGRGTYGTAQGIVTATDWPPK
jgi:uncharacterized protein (TIGR00369 family)